MGSEKAATFFVEHNNETVDVLGKKQLSPVASAHKMVFLAFFEPKSSGLAQLAQSFF
jgi:hypothetical protein